MNSGPRLGRVLFKLDCRFRVLGDRQRLRRADRLIANPHRGIRAVALGYARFYEPDVIKAKYKHQADETQLNAEMAKFTKDLSQEKKK